MARFFKRAFPKGEAATDAARPEPRPDAPRTDFDSIKPQPEQIGIAGSVPFVRLPDPARLFADRAARLRSLAPEHPLGGYLVFLAGIASAQAAIVEADVPPGRGRGDAPDGGAVAHDPDAVALRLEHGMPPLARSAVGEDPRFLVRLDALLARLDLAGAPEATRAARDALEAATPEDRIDLAVQLFEGAIPVERMAECVFVAAALQVHLAVLAAGLDPKELKPVADGVCPACGGAPTASLIVGWTQADKARYLSCSGCGTLWNHVRIRCTACGSGEDVAYSSLDEISKDVQVETCGACKAYLKHLHQHRQPSLDPVADDVASYGLDLKIAEEGFKRAGLNLLFVN